MESLYAKIAVGVDEHSSFSPASQFRIQPTVRKQAFQEHVIDKVRLAGCRWTLYFDDITPVERPIPKGAPCIHRGKVGIKGWNPRETWRGSYVVVSLENGNVMDCTQSASLSVETAARSCSQHRLDSAACTSTHSQTGEIRSVFLPKARLR